METQELVTNALENLQNQITQKVFERECCDCGAVIQLEVTPFARSVEGQVRAVVSTPLDARCPHCAQKRYEERKREAEAARAAAIERRLTDAVPATFHDTDRAHLPQPAKLDAALAWKFGQRGLLLLGPTRTGKSRVLWEVAKREIRAGRKVKAVTPYELLRYPALFMAGNDAAGKFAEELAKADVLLLDDAFKAKLTERVEELIFAVLDERSQWNRPCLVTVNDTGETLEGRLSSDRGPALVARLREFCEAITFQ